MSWVGQMAIYTQDDEYDSEELDDLALAICLLTGRHDWKDGLPQKRYLNPDEEFVARKALARLLRNLKPLDSAVRRQLAALFDPETETAPFSSFDSAPIERRLEFKTRHRGGGKTQALRKLEIGIAFDGLMKHPKYISDPTLRAIVERYEVRRIDDFVLPDGERIPQGYAIAREDALAAIAERFKVSTRTVEMADAHLKKIVGER
jgi:hypothetical protein